MGIKGIYKEIGPGQRISLSKLAISSLESSSSSPRPFRLAIDISIWQFQVQAARGGTNPAIRTLFYRLVRLLSLAIHPIFVFDGPHKPAFKRGKKVSGRPGDRVGTAQAKQMIRLFGFTLHDAPGEAEAECALLQREGVVDAVLSEDVDTIMFGCQKTLRNWTAEGKGSKTPTHVTLYDAAEIAKGSSGLDREGMVLVALMSGGDYMPEGVPGCGIKVACEAARAGFGKELCKIKQSDEKGRKEWRERLKHELQTNESGFFRIKHKALEIPEDFPDMESLGYYTHPVVSKQATVDRLKRDFPPVRAQVDVSGLREFVRGTFDWEFLGGAYKLIRTLAPGLLTQKMLERFSSPTDYGNDTEREEEDEAALVKTITKRREHFSADATPELRISFIPIKIVPLDLENEPIEEVEEHGRTGLALNSDDDFDAGEADEEKKGAKKPFDPSQPDLIWVPETLAKLCVPLTVEDWETRQRAKEHKKTGSQATKISRAKKLDAQAGALDKYVSVTKAVSVINSKDNSPTKAPPAKPSVTTKPKPTKRISKKSTTEKPSADINPWSIAWQASPPRATQSFLSQPPPQKSASSFTEPILISSSPVAVYSPPPSLSPVSSPAETTLTRQKRHQTPSQAPSYPSQQEVAHLTSSPTRASASRPLKRSKSGAGDNITSSTSFVSVTATATTATTTASLKMTAITKTTRQRQQPSSQSSIKSFGRTVKNNPITAARSRVKPLNMPVEFLSSDPEEEDSFLEDDALPSLETFSKTRFSSTQPQSKPLPTATARGALSRGNTAPPTLPPSTTKPTQASRLQSIFDGDDDDDVFGIDSYSSNSYSSKPRQTTFQRTGSAPPLNVKVASSSRPTLISTKSATTTTTTTTKSAAPAIKPKPNPSLIFADFEDSESEIECVDLTAD